MAKTAGAKPKALPPFLRRNKYGSKKTVIDGITFDSKKEAARWLELKALEASGAITKLERQLSFPFVLNGKKICTYRCDFAYFDQKTKARVYEDVKGYRTDIYRLKKKMLHAFFPLVELREV